MKYNFITLWTALKMKAGRRNVSVRLSQPSLLWKLTHGCLPFYSWVGLLVWDCSTVLAMHLLVFLANLVHREVCVCTEMFSMLSINVCVLIISIVCFWLYYFILDIPEDCCDTHRLLWELLQEALTFELCEVHMRIKNLQNVLFLCSSN